MKTTLVRRMRGAAALAACGLLVGGCETAHETHASSGKVLNRPMVQQTAVESSIGQDSATLSFFDDLESQPLASQDDAINATLLLGTGVTGSTYEQRVAMAKELGYVPKNYDRPARQAVTTGEVAVMSVVILEGKHLSDEEALKKLVHRGIAPPTAKPNQGLTGAQLVSVAGGVRDAMGIEGVKRVPAPKVAEPIKTTAKSLPPLPEMDTAKAETPGSAETPKPAAAAKPATTKTASPESPSSEGLTTKGVALGEAASGAKASVAPKPASAAKTEAEAPIMAKPAGGWTKGRKEPLPEIPAGTPTPTIDLQDPNSKPSVIGPDEKVYTPGQPKKPAPTTAAPVKPADTKPADPKPAPTEPKPEAKPEPKSGEMNAEASASGVQGQTDVKLDAKRTAKNPWVLGQPLKKSARADETK